MPGAPRGPDGPQRRSVIRRRVIRLSAGG